MNQRVVKKRQWLSSTVIVVVFCFFCSWIQRVEGACDPSSGCSTALVWYRVQAGDTDPVVLANRFQTTVDVVSFYNNRSDSIHPGQTLRIPFPCGCRNDELQHSFQYQVQQSDTLNSIANTTFGGLSNADRIAQASGKGITDTIYPGESLQVPVQCFCGNPNMTAFGLFTTYIAVSTDNASSLSETFSTCKTLLQLFNPSVDFTAPSLAEQTLFIPSTNGTNGPYPPFQSSGADTTSACNRRVSMEVVVAIVSVWGAVTLALFILVLCLAYSLFSIKRQSTKVDDEGLERGLVSSTGSSQMHRLSQILRSGRSGMLKFAGGDSQSQHSAPLRSWSGPLRSGLPSSGPLTPSSGTPSARRAAAFWLDKSVEFTFVELAAATNNFSVANKIGEGGYGSVYMGTLRGQVMAVKRMNIQATREFLSELQILTHVHHTHLVQLIGFCTVESLFLIYEYVENGPLEKHLQRRDGLPPLSWPARVQIALDAARGLEYIHEHTKPTYIHRDVKSNNILLDKQLRAKVADFGLTKLTDTGFSSASISMSVPTTLVGTFGYMPPEYAKYGDVSPKVDVYSFGVVLLEIISGKSAIVKTLGPSGNPRILHEDQKSLVEMFEEVLKHPRGQEALRGLVDPALEHNYSLESAWKMAHLASECTRDNPELRPGMRSVVVSLMTLSSVGIGSFGKNTVIPGLMSGR